MPAPSSQTADQVRSSDEILDHVKRLHPKRMDLSLGRMESLLAKLDHPETKLPPVIHVAGTNGKGSTTAFLKAMLEAAGYGVHVYTSPHLVRFAERIQLAAADGASAIAEDHLSDLLAECEAANGDDPITFFEITTACAFLAFSRSPADVVLLEVGLGGRLDATNVIDKPALTVITPVSIDHVQFLGERLAQIADEKAGILKPGVPCIVAPQLPVAMTQIKDRAMAINTPLVTCEDKPTDQNYWSVTGDTRGLTVSVCGQELSCPPPALPGAHQLVNAGLAVAALKYLPGFDIPDAAVFQGLTKVSWPGRLQDLRQGHAARRLPEGSELWLDGGHNEAAGIALGETLAVWQTQDPRPTYAICGMMNVKDISGFVSCFRDQVDGLYGLTIPGEENALPAEDIVTQAGAAGVSSMVAASVNDALDQIATRSADGPAPRVLICGSLYLAGSVLAEEQGQTKEPGEFSR